MATVDVILIFSLEDFLRENSQWKHDNLNLQIILSFWEIKEFHKAFTFYFKEHSGLDSVAGLIQAHGSLSHLGKALDLPGQNVTIKEICADGLMGSQVSWKANVLLGQITLAYGRPAKCDHFVKTGYLGHPMGKHMGVHGVGIPATWPCARETFKRSRHKGLWCQSL